jgi:hypothetical protein
MAGEWQDTLRDLLDELVEIRITAIQVGVPKEIEAELTLAIDTMRDLLDSIDEPAATHDYFLVPVRRIRHTNRAQGVADAMGGGL